MPDAESRELISLCASILSDDEVTADEAYTLAEWLNNHPAATESWPGKVLIGLLQEIWADGTASARDLQRLARLLGGLEREWVRRSTPADTHRKVKLVDFARTHKKTPLVPRIDATVEIVSWDEADTTYRVNLRGPSCTCPEWVRWKSHLPAGHLSRCCKHIFDAYAQLPRGHAGTAWLMAFLDLGRPTSANIKWKLLEADSADPVLISSANKKGWASVFAREDSEYRRFGYNVEERRWSYGVAPESAPAIADEIVSLSRAEPGPATEAKAKEKPNKTTSRATPPSFVRQAAAVIALAAALAFAFVSFRSQQLNPAARAPAAQSGPRWTVRATSDIRLQSAGRPIVIPRGTELRVIARTPSEVRVSFGGEAVTIPIAQTDLK